MRIQKITESIIPIILLLCAIFLLLLYVEYRASQDSDKSEYIHITSKSQAENLPDARMNTVIDIDFSDDPRILRAQELIKHKKFKEAETIYFAILAKEASAQIHNWLGTLYLKSKAYDKAVVSFSNALKLNSKYYRARYNRALVYNILNETQKAITDYLAVIKDFDAHVKSHFNLGLLYYKEKTYPKAAYEFQRTASLSSGSTKIKALYLLGKSYIKSIPSKKNKAINIFKEVIRLKPNHIASRLALVELEYPHNKRGYKKQLEQLEIILLLEPENISIYQAISKIYRKLSNDKNALKSLQSALLHSPNNISLQFEIVELLIHLKHYHDGEIILKNILIINPKSTKVFFLLGRSYYLQEEFEEALSAYNKVVLFKPQGSPELWNNLGLLYAKLKRFDEAKIMYEKSLKLRNNYPEVYYNIGVLFSKQDKLKEAQDYFEQAITQRAKYFQAYYNLALVLAKQEKNDKSISAYHKALTIKPNSIRVKLNLAVRYSKSNKFNKAKVIYEEILKKDSSYFTAWLNLGLVYNSLKEYTLSQEALEQAVKLNPESKKAYRALAKNYSVQKMHDKAVKTLRNLLNKNPADLKTRLAYARAYYRAKKRNTALREYNKVIKLDPNNQIAKKMIKKIQIKKRKRNAKK